MSDLSPAAQAVYNAVLEICPAPADEIAAAALRAAKNQVAPHQNVPNSPMDWGEYNMTEIIRERLDAIAFELEVNG